MQKILAKINDFLSAFDWFGSIIVSSVSSIISVVGSDVGLNDEANAGLDVATDVGADVTIDVGLDVGSAVGLDVGTYVGEQSSISTVAVSSIEYNPLSFITFHLPALQTPIL